MSPAEARVLAAVEKAAADNRTCPTNTELAEVAGFNSVGAASGVLSRLQKLGLIAIQRGQCSRVVTITSTGAQTAGAVGSPHWRDRPGFVASPRKSSSEIDKTIARLKMEERAETAPQPVYRDPCWSSGARGDAG